MARGFPTGVDLKGNKAVNMADGSAASDGATWGQVQSFLAGLAWKPAVRAASTANVTVASPGASIDGVSLSAGDRVLLKNQTAGAENGLWQWNGAATPMTRVADADAAAELKSATVLVQEGTANADTAWTQTVDTITLGTTTLTFVQFGGTASYTASSTGGLQLVGTVFSVKLPASSGLIADATGLYIDVAIVVRKYAANFGDGTTTAYAITHNLNTKDVQVRVFDNTSNAEEDPDIVHNTVNQVTITYTTAPASNAKRVVVQG